MPEIWECYGHGVPGTAIVSAPSRATALQACFEWLGWQVGVAFKRAERFVLWTNCGGTADRPVVYAADNEHFMVLAQRAPEPEDAESGAWERWEDKL